MLCLLLVAGCAPAPRGGTPLQQIDKKLAEPSSPTTKTEEPPPLPPEITAALIPASGSMKSGEVTTEPHFDISASDVPAHDFFMSLVEGSQVNMIVHPKVTGTISANLKNTTIEEVLAVIHNVYGYPYFKTGNIYQVMPVGLQARTFHMDYLNLVRKGTSQIKVSSGQVTQTENNSNDNDNNNNNDNGNGNGDSTTGSQIDTSSTADFWGELRSAIEHLIGSKDGRKVVVQPQASTIVVVAEPNELMLVDKYLKMIQSNIRRQVIIEAKIIEVRLSDGFQSGINWAALGESSSGKSVLAAQTGGGTIFDSGHSESAGNSGNLTPGGVLPNALDSLAFGGVFSLALNFNDFKAFIELLEGQGDVQVLSSPRISTINNQKAVIKVGSDEYFVTDVSSDTSTGTTTTTSNDITLTPFFSGIALDVTPQIDPDGQITLHIHPAISEVTDQTKQLAVNGNIQSIPVAFSTIRETDSVVFARSGQLVVIGGLMQEHIDNKEVGVPVLGDIPWIGSIFRHTKMVSRKSELVILLRPQVIGSPADWQRNIDMSRQRIERLAPEFKQDWRQF